MTDSPTVEQKKSRRGLLALVGAGGAAAVAALLGRRNGAEAAPGANFIIGDQSNEAWGQVTKLTAYPNDKALYVHNTSTGASADGLWGQTSGSGGWGVYGNSSGSSGTGVRGYCYGTGGRGVEGECPGTSGLGVLGVGGQAGVKGSSADGAGMIGSSDSSVGVVGTSTGAPVGFSEVRWGVAGVGDEGGVAGFSFGGPGVKGSGKPGVYGITYVNSGAGVRGEGQAPGSIGVLALNTPRRRALRTKGKVQMDCARKVTLSNRDNLIALPSGTRADTNAIVLAVVQGSPGNGALVRRAYRADSTHIRIDFDKRPDNPTAVGYWVVHTG